MTVKFHSFWVPQYKWQLIEWLMRHFNEPKSNFKNRTKDQLYAIYFNARTKENGGMETNGR